MNYFTILRSALRLAIFIPVLFFVACTKNVAGPQGDPGTPGKPGNLKESHTGVLKLTSSSWHFNAGNYWEATLYVSDITDKVITSGEVKVYREVDAQWWGLPYGKDFIFTKYSIEEGLIHLNCSHIHGGTPGKPLDANYRVVVLQPAK